jgi:hypothetical protein
MKILFILVALFTVIESQAACNNKSLVGQYAYDYNIPVNGVNYYNYGTMTFDGKNDRVQVGGLYGQINTGLGGITYNGIEGGVPATATGTYLFNSKCELSITIDMYPIGYTKHREYAFSSYGVMNGDTVISGGGTVYLAFVKGDKLYPPGGAFNGPFSLRKK